MEANVGGGGGYIEQGSERIRNKEDADATAVRCRRRRMGFAYWYWLQGHRGRS